MTDEPEPALEFAGVVPPTAAEDALYEAMTAGDWDAVDDARAAAYEAEQAPDPDTGLTPAAQFEVDHAGAHARYQADHEAPESERILHTEAAVNEQNAAAQEIEDVRG